MHKPSGILSKLKWGLYRLLPDRWLRVSLKHHSKLALTFDDGPHPEITPKILDLLDRFKIQATFYLIGEKIVQYPEVASEIVARGHVIGNHSYSHRGFIKQPLAVQLQEIKQTEQLLTQLDGRKRHGFRPPGGKMNVKLLLALIKAGITIDLWSLNSLDYLYFDADQLVEAFKQDTTISGDIVLLHDDGLHTVQGLERLIPKWMAMGFGFVTYN